MTELTKKDWEDLLKSSEANIKQYTIGLLQFENLKKLAEGKIAEFPDETKEVEEEIESLK